MKECLIDVLSDRDTVLRVFPITLENQDGTTKAVAPEREPLALAANMQLVPEVETKVLHARPHISRGGQLAPYGDLVEVKHQMLERTEHSIRERAYFLWRQEGCSENRADEHWYRACEIEGKGGST